MDTALTRFRSLVEFAAATTSELSRSYYHGTTKERGAAIMQAGEIRPGAAVQGRGRLDPVVGRPYLTPDIGSALIYALGRNYAGVPNTAYTGRGYVFVVPGTELTDIQPDEDQVGELIHTRTVTPEMKAQFGYKMDQTQVPDWVYNWGRKVVSPRAWEKAEDGEYSYFAVAGKQMLRKMSQTQKRELLDLGMHVANEGTVRPTEVWLVDWSKAPQFKRDGSNFFEIAQRVDWKPADRGTV